MKTFVIIIGSLFLILNLSVIEIQAATLTVANLNNSGVGSLRLAIVNATAGV